MTEHSGRAGDEYVLTSDQIDQVRRDGYVKLSGVIGAEELEGIEPNFERFIRGHVPGMGRDFCDMAVP